MALSSLLLQDDVIFLVYRLNSHGKPTVFDIQVLVNISPTYPTGCDNTGGTKDLC